MRKIPIVIGLLYGDEGKGTTVSYLCSQSPIDYVVRFSGGPQTAHNVVMDDGREHTFSQFGSGTFHGAGTIISEFMLVNPFNLVVEADHLGEKLGYNPLDDTYISKKSLLITPIHVMANRQREINRGGNAHGSCGEGVGETRSYALFQTEKYPIVMEDLLIKDALSYLTLVLKLESLKEFFEKEIDGFVYENSIEDLVDEYIMLMNDKKLNIVSDDEILKMIANENFAFVFEGSQGVLLDESFGFHPHTTWSDVTDKNARLLMDKAGLDSKSVASTIGITRTYTTRHGYGPFPSEFSKDYDTWRNDYPEKHNAWGQFQGSWRGGVLDLTLLKYSLEVLGDVDFLSLTHCDIPVKEVVTAWEEDYHASPQKDRPHQIELTRLLNSFTMPTKVAVKDTDELIALIESELNIPVKILSYGPMDKDKKQL